VYSEEDFNHDLKVVFPFNFTLVVTSFILWIGLEDMCSLSSYTHKELPDAERKSMETKLINIVDNLISDFTNFGYINL
jgi:hypothetical protein